MLSRALIEILEPNRLKKIEEIKEYYQNLGPGHLDGWLYLAGENCWQQREGVTSTFAQKKIIISDGFLAQRVPSNSDLAVISALINQYPVYLWPEGNHYFNEIKPVNSSAEFWQKRGKLKPATKEAVENELAGQGIATNEFIILDNQAYRQLLKKLSEKPIHFFAPSEKILSTYEAEESEVIIKPSLQKESVVAEMKAALGDGILENITLQTINHADIEITLKNFPKLQKLTIDMMKKKGNFTTLQQSIKDNGNKNLSLELKNYVLTEKIEITEQIKELKLVQTITKSTLEIIDKNADGNNLESIQFIDPEIDVYKELSELNKMIIRSKGAKSLLIEKHTDLSELVIDTQELEELKIIGLKPRKVKLSENKKLKTLHVKNLRSIEWLKDYFSTIEELKIEECELEELDLNFLIDHNLKS